MDPQKFYGLRRKNKSVTYIPDSSEDENISGDEDYMVPKPIQHVTICDSDSNDEFNEYQGQLEQEVDSEDESEVDEGDNSTEQPSTSKQNTGKGGEKHRQKLIWSNEAIEYDEAANVFLGIDTLPEEIMRLSTPIEFFKFMFPSTALNLIEEESNVYAVQITQNNFTKVTNEDICKFLGIIIYMSVVHLPTTRHYWKEGTYVEKVASTMTCNKFEEIKRFLHFFDKTKELKPENPKFDKLQKIRPLINILRDRLQKVPREEYLSIDEQMIPTKARTSGIRQYNAKKPHKWGYLNYVLSGASGFSYDFEIYAGKHSGPPEGCTDLGVPGNVVQRLLETVSHHLNHKIFIDNWYTTLALMANLHKIGILPLGTIQLNRAKDIPLSKKDLMKKPRGHCEVKSTVIDNVQLAVTTWVDNKVVTLCSSYVAAEPLSNVKRYMKKQKSKIDVSCPKSIKIYNKYMGGVDLLDAMLGFYRIKIRSKKWYHRLFFHFVDLTCVNSWLLWRRSITQRGENIYMPLMDFKLNIADIMIAEDTRVFTPTRRGRPLNEVVQNVKKGKLKRRRIELPPIEVAEDGFNHWPEWKSDRQRCKLVGCTQKSQIMCLKCKCYLCLNKDRNCFKQFHKNNK